MGCGASKWSGRQIAVLHNPSDLTLFDPPYEEEASFISPESENKKSRPLTTLDGAVDEARTRDLHLGKVALYQLSYYRKTASAVDGRWSG